MTLFSGRGSESLTFLRVGGRSPRYRFRVGARSQSRRFLIRARSPVRDIVVGSRLGVCDIVVGSDAKLWTEGSPWAPHGSPKNLIGRVWGPRSTYSWRSGSPSSFSFGLEPLSTEVPWTEGRSPHILGGVGPQFRKMLWKEGAHGVP